MGQIAPLGTGEFEVLLNEKLLEEASIGLDMAPIYGDRSLYMGSMTPGAATPYVGGDKTPWYSLPSPGPLDASFSPQIEAGLGGSFSPAAAYVPKSPGYALRSPGFRFVTLFLFK